MLLTDFLHIFLFSLLFYTTENHLIRGSNVPTRLVLLTSSLVEKEHQRFAYIGRLMEAFSQLKFFHA